MFDSAGDAQIVQMIKAIHSQPYLIYAMSFSALFDADTRHLSVRCGLDWKLDQNDAILDTRRKRLNAWRGGRRTQNVSRLEAYFQRVQRTDDRRAGDNALRQRAALVRAAVFDGQEAVAEVKDGDVAAGETHGTPLAQRDFLAPRSLDPSVRVAHRDILSIGSICTN
jgi:hypothetical protein